jgi:hypothetical protein
MQLLVYQFVCHSSQTHSSDDLGFVYTVWRLLSPRIKHTVGNLGKTFTKNTHEALFFKRVQILANK